MTDLDANPDVLARLDFAPLPSRSEAIAAIPRACFERRLRTSLGYLAQSLVLTVGSGLLAWTFLPLDLVWAPLWVLYALATGTVAVGLWVLAHECGHRGFCAEPRANDAIGFVVHSALLVPYFSWQRSHAVHHAKTNHLVDGETHVPKVEGTRAGDRSDATGRRVGERVHAVLTLVGRLVFGWPLYLLVGATGGSGRGVTNHFYAGRPFDGDLFPGRWQRRVLYSTAGVAATLAALVGWAVAAGSIVPVLALYVGPYLVCNAWVVAYTWLQHTDVDIPHYSGENWNYVRGAFTSVDRPYRRVIDRLHHRIGTTHVAHHLEAKIPHYHAAEATEALALAFPAHYRYDDTPVVKALWRVARRCHVVAPRDDGWSYRRVP